MQQAVLLISIASLLSGAALLACLFIVPWIEDQVARMEHDILQQSRDVKVQSARLWKDIMGLQQRHKIIRRKTSIHIIRVPLPPDPPPAEPLYNDEPWHPKSWEYESYDEFHDSRRSDGSKNHHDKNLKLEDGGGTHHDDGWEYGQQVTSGYSHDQDDGYGERQECQCDSYKARACPPGPPGLAGDPGQRGDDGIPGMPGSRGLPGREAMMQRMCNSNCPPPMPGRRGSPGPPGRHGEPGMTGRKAVMTGYGQKAPPGPPGKTGTRGMPGWPGLPGKMGGPGRNGVGMMQNGYGKRSMKGRPGMRGLPGPAGPPGRPGKPGCQLPNAMTPGDYGMQVEICPAGDTGNPGRPGEDGRPGMGGRHGYMGPKGTDGKPGNDGHYCNCPRRTVPAYGKGMPPAILPPDERYGEQFGGAYARRR